jgi:hypothetical protein
MRRVVLNMSEDEIVELATTNAQMFKDIAATTPRPSGPSSTRPRCIRTPSWSSPSA